VLVYAPAFEYNNLSPSSFILDEETSFGDYNPKNSSNNYIGWTNIKSSISKSLNIPAVKTLSYVGIEKAKDFASNLGIKFNEKDNHLALALGGFTNGTTVKEIADAYTCFSNLGVYQESNFITKIEDKNGKILYKNTNNPKRVMKEDTAYMITYCLTEAANNGTAKKVKLENIELASKTGTTNNNKDAWSATYSPDYTCITWIGNLNSTPLNGSIKGSSYPSLISREIFKNLYRNTTSSKFDIPDSIIFAELDKNNLDKTKLNITQNKDTPLTSESIGIFTLENLPNLTNNNLDNTPFIEVKNINSSHPEIKIKCNNADKLTIFRENNNKIAVLKELNNYDGEFLFTDESTKKDVIYSYYYTIKKGDQTTTSNKIKIKTF